jgi:hypothetical protein
MCVVSYALVQRNICSREYCEILERSSSLNVPPKIRFLGESDQWQEARYCIIITGIWCLWTKTTCWLSFKDLLITFVYVALYIASVFPIHTTGHFLYGIKVEECAAAAARVHLCDPSINETRFVLPRQMSSFRSTCQSSPFNFFYLLLTNNLPAGLSRRVGRRC